MRNKVYSKRQRKIYSLFNQILKNSFIAKLIHKDQIISDPDIDPQTGIYNLYAISSYLKELYPHAESNFGIILLSIDNLTEIKEKFKLNAAHKVVASIAQELLKNIRDTDLIGRYSESEFILILNDVNLDQANHVAQRLTQLINKNPLKVMGKPISIKVSFGSSISQHDTMSNAVLEQADQALHIAKSNPNRFYSSTGVVS